MMEYVKEFFHGEKLKIILEVIQYIFVIFGTYLLTQIKKIKEKLKNRRAHAKQYDEEVEAKVIELRVLTEANRAYVFQRHNGTKNNNGTGMDKVTMYYEITDASTRKMIGEDSEDMKLHLFGKDVEKLDDDNYLILNVDDLEDGYTRNTMISRGVVLAVIVPFRRSKHDLPEGYTGISYTHIDLEDFEKEKENILMIVKNYSSEIGFLLRD